MDSKFKFDQIGWGRLTDEQYDGGQEFERSRDPRRPIQNGIMKKSYDLRLQGQREIPRDFDGKVIMKILTKIVK